MFGQPFRGYFASLRLSCWIGRLTPRAHWQSPEPPFPSCAVPGSASVAMFELARIMGTSAKMIEQHFGTLIYTAHDAILPRLEASN
jgi:hypothetical protein